LRGSIEVKSIFTILLQERVDDQLWWIVEVATLRLLLLLLYKVFLEPRLQFYVLLFSTDAVFGLRVVRVNQVLIGVSVLGLENVWYRKYTWLLIKLEQVFIEVALELRVSH
jgi:hypothetical protein